MEQNGTASTNGSTENWKKFPFAMESLDAGAAKEIKKHFHGKHNDKLRHSVQSI